MMARLGSTYVHAHSSLLGLPVEIRLLIYDYAFEDSFEHVQQHHDLNGDPELEGFVVHDLVESLNNQARPQRPEHYYRTSLDYGHGLRSTNRQISEESATLARQIACSRIVLDCKAHIALIHLARCSPQQRAHVKSMWLSHAMFAAQSTSSESLWRPSPTTVDRNTWDCQVGDYLFTHMTGLQEIWAWLAESASSQDADSFTGFLAAYNFAHGFITGAFRVLNVCFMKAQPFEKGELPLMKSIVAEVEAKLGGLDRLRVNLRDQELPHFGPGLFTIVSLHLEDGPFGDYLPPVGVTKSLKRQRTCATWLALGDYEGFATALFDPDAS